MLDYAVLFIVMILLGLFFCLAGVIADAMTERIERRRGNASCEVHLQHRR